jgi:hypothetical protein
MRVGPGCDFARGLPGANPGIVNEGLASGVVPAVLYNKARQLAYTSRIEPIRLRTIISVGLDVNLGHLFWSIFVSYEGLKLTISLLFPLEPTPHNHDNHVHEIQANKSPRFPCIYYPIPEEEKQTTDSGSEKANVSQERIPVHPKRLDDTHRSDDTRHDE